VNNVHIIWSDIARAKRYFRSSSFYNAGQALPVAPAVPTPLFHQVFVHGGWQSHVVSTSAIDCLERSVSLMMYCVNC